MQITIIVVIKIKKLHRKKNIKGDETRDPKNVLMEMCHDFFSKDAMT